MMENGIYQENAMSETKVNASFILQGRVLPAEPSQLKKREKRKKEKKKKEEKNYEVSYHEEMIRLHDRSQIVIKVRDAKPITQTLHLNADAYEYMISDNNPAQGFKSFMWKKLSKRQRLKAHLEVIANDLYAKLDNFSILED